MHSVVLRTHEGASVLHKQQLRGSWQLEQQRHACTDRLPQTLQNMLSLAV